MVTRRRRSVVGLVDQSNPVGIGAQDGFGSIGRAVVDADYLEIGKSLREDTIHGRGNRRGRVIGGNNYRNAAHRWVRARPDFIGYMRQRLGKFEDRTPQRGRLSNQDDNDYMDAD